MMPVAVSVGVSVLVSMASSSSRPEGLVLDGWELFFGPPAGRGAAGELVELPGQVGLVVVAGLGGDGGEAGSVGLLELPAGPFEAHDPGVGLGRQPDLGPEALGEVPPAPAALGGEVGHADGAAGGA